MLYPPHNAGVALGANGNVLDLAADQLFQALDVVLGLYRQVLKLADAGDVAVPAGNLLHNRLGIVQGLAHGVVVLPSVRR